jgi:hypothetical protein
MRLHKPGVLLGKIQCGKTRAFIERDAVHVFDIMALPSLTRLELNQKLILVIKSASISSSAIPPKPSSPKTHPARPKHPRPPHVHHLRLFRRTLATSI